MVDVFCLASDVSHQFLVLTLRYLKVIVETNTIKHYRTISDNRLSENPHARTIMPRTEF